MIVGATGVIGALGGVAKSHFLDKPDVQRGLEREFQKYRTAVAQNNANITDSFECISKNQELKDNFNKLCNYWYNTGLKKANKKNIIIGSLIGIAVGIAGVVTKNLLKKKNTAVNETITDKTK